MPPPIPTHPPEPPPATLHDPPDLAAKSGGVGATAPNQQRCDVFISYRRSGGAELARLLAERLTSRGYRVFLDADTLGAGSWSAQLQRQIDECRDFVAVVTQGYFDRCVDNEDVVRQEIARALTNGTNVVPLLVAHPPFPAALPADIADLPNRNGVKYVHEYSNEAVEKLCTHLVSSPLLGPERLHTPEAQPKVVVGTVGFLVGAWQGASAGELVSRHWGPYEAFVQGLFWALCCLLLIGLPLFMVLALVSYVLKIRRDVLYGGPWLPFWGLFAPLAFVLSSVVVAVLFRWFDFKSYFFGGLVGGAVGAGLAAMFIWTNVWTIVSTMFRGKKA